MMSLPVDSEIHELKLGNSFDSNSTVGFHTIRYDFKPASVDTGKEACVEVGARNQVTVTVPHVENSGVAHTVFKGNKQPLMKECVLIIDHETGTYTLEKLNSKITVKKTRLDGSSKAMQHITGLQAAPSDKKHSSTKSSKRKSSQKQHSPNVDSTCTVTTVTATEALKGDEDVSLVGEITDSSDEEISQHATDTHKKNPPQSTSQMHKFGVLDDDLALSESGSDSD